MYIMSEPIDVDEKLSEQDVDDKISELIKLVKTVNEMLKMMDEKKGELEGEVKKCNEQLKQIKASEANTKRIIDEKLNNTIKDVKGTIDNVSDGDGTDRGAGTYKGNVAAEAGAAEGGAAEAGAAEGGMGSIMYIGQMLGINSDSSPSKKIEPPTISPQEGGGRRRNRGTKRKQKKDKRTTRRRRYTRGKK